MSQENTEKKPWYKKWWIWLIVAVAVIGAAGAVGGNESTPSEAPSNTVNVVVEETPGSELEDINFTVSKVNNDVTGNWRISSIAEPISGQKLTERFYDVNTGEEVEMD